MIVGTAGHIDHGKTTLVRALTGVDTDRLKEEKARGISIDLGFAYLPTPGGDVIGFIDVPGHERFVHTMLAGAGGIDFVLLVVAADDGIMPQTREHLAIVDLLGVERGAVALAKADLAPPERRAEVAAEIRAAIAETALAGAEIVPVSTVTGEGVEELRALLLSEARSSASRDSAGRFRLAVDRSFTLQGVGTVVTGTVLSGTVHLGDKLTVSPKGLSARVRSIHTQNRPAERGSAGERCALNLVGESIGKEAIARGDVVLDPELHAPSDRIDASLRVLAGEPKAIGQWFPARLHHGAAEVGARIVLLGDEPVAPGGEAKVQLVLERPIAAAAGDRYVLRDSSARRTIGGGRFLDLRAPSRKRRAPARLAELEARAIADPERAVAALLALPPHCLDLTAFLSDRALGPDQATRIVMRLGLVPFPQGGSLFVFSPGYWIAFKAGLIATLGAFHADNPDLPGIGREKLRLELEPRLPTVAFMAVLQELARAGEVALDGAWVRLPGHTAQLTAPDERLWREISALIGGEARFRPPRVRDLAGLIAVPEPEVRRLMKLVGRMGKVSEVAHDHFFLRTTVAEMVEIVRALAAEARDRQFTAAEFRDHVQNGRKVAIQILEFFDRHGITLRRGDRRRINPDRLDLFSASADDAKHDGSGRESSLVGRPDFKSGRGREPVLGGFDSHSLPPIHGESR